MSRRRPRSHGSCHTPHLRSRARRPWSTPAAGATVWLTRHEKSDFDLAGSTIFAQTQAGADGRFTLAPLPSALEQSSEDPAEFEVWIWKPGLAVAAHELFRHCTRRAVDRLAARRKPADHSLAAARRISLQRRDRDPHARLVRGRSQDQATVADLRATQGGTARQMAASKFPGGIAAASRLLSRPKNSACRPRNLRLGHTTTRRLS